MRTVVLSDGMHGQVVGELRMLRSKELTGKISGKSTPEIKAHCDRVEYLHELIVAMEGATVS